MNAFRVFKLACLDLDARISKCIYFALLNKSTKIFNTSLLHTDPENIATPRLQDNVLY